MSDLTKYLNRANSKKILLCEMDIGQGQDFWTNYRAGVWMVNFNKYYPDIDSSLLAGVSAQDISKVGSVKASGVSLRPVATKADVQANDSSFHYDSNFKSLYVHCPDGDDPDLFLMMIGVSYGTANHGGVYSGFIYEGRLISVPSIAKSKDPLFFGVVSFEGGDVTIDNTNGKFDRFAEDNDVFGNAARLLLGFDDMPYEDFIPRMSGYMERVQVTQTQLTVGIQDKRKQLSRSLPPNVFDDSTYPNIKEKNVGKGIPLGYGSIKNAPVVCTNEEESGPSNWQFKICDTEFHSIKEITTVYVEGVSKTPTATDLDEATFMLNLGDYNKGDDVTCTFKGYVDALGNLIENGLHVVRDLLLNYYGVKYNSNFYNIARWDEGKAPAVNYFIKKEKKLIDIIGEIAETVQGDFIVNDDGRFAFRIYDPYAGAVQRIYQRQLLEVPQFEYDPSEVLTSIKVGYAKDWAEDEYLWLDDKSQETDIFKKFKTYLSEDFETLLTTKAAAQDFADKRLELSGDVKKTFTVLLKPGQVILREIDDVIIVTVMRPAKTMLNDCKAEIIGIENDGNAMTVKLTCRLITILAEMYVENECYYGDTYYGDNYYGATELRSA